MPPLLQMRVPASTPIVIRGRYFWRDEHRFIVCGVVYQADRPRHEKSSSNEYIDPIADENLPRLQYDVALLKELGINTIFVYRIDHTKARANAMKLLEEAGIYVFITVSTPHNSISRNDPYKSYNATNMEAYLRTIDAMASFPNTLGVHAAHGVVNRDENLSCMPVIVAVVRDLKRYMKLKHQADGQRVLPIGYGAGHSVARNVPTLEYLSSGDEMSRIDFFTFTNYMWVSPSSLQISGYNSLIERFQDTKIPIFFSEYGANPRGPRSFDETRALHSPEMTDVFSGGCVYEFWQHVNHYGLAKLLNEQEEAALADPRPFEDRPSTWSSLGSVEKIHGGRVAETRKTELGTLLLYEDFVNYKASLEATREIAPNTREVVSVVATERPPLGFDGIGEIPQTCVDWSVI